LGRLGPKEVTNLDYDSLSEGEMIRREIFFNPSFRGMRAGEQEEQAEWF
jgi:hypothetical protein